MVIPLPHGKSMQMNAEDLPVIDGCRVIVGSSGYAMAYYEGIIAPVSRLIMGLDKGDRRQVDHINHDILDNRRENLRIVTGSQNKWNTAKKVTNTSGFKGVYWRPKKQRWAASITVHRKIKWLGTFETAELAAAAYAEAAKLHHGEYAHT